MSERLLQRIDELQSCARRSESDGSQDALVAYFDAIANFSDQLQLVTQDASRIKLAAFLQETVLVALQRFMRAAEHAEELVHPLLRVFAVAEQPLLAAVAAFLAAQLADEKCSAPFKLLLANCSELLALTFGILEQRVAELTPAVAGKALSFLSCNADLLSEVCESDPIAAAKMSDFVTAIFASHTLLLSPEILDELDEFHVSLLRSTLTYALKIKAHYDSLQSAADFGKRLKLLYLEHLLYEHESCTIDAPFNWFEELLTFLTPELFLYEERYVFFELIEREFPSLDRVQSAKFFVTTAELAARVTSNNALLLIFCLKEIATRNRELMLELLYDRGNSSAHAQAARRAVNTLLFHHCATVANACKGLIDDIVVKKSPAEIRKQLHQKYNKTSQHLVKDLANKCIKSYKKIYAID